MAEHIGDIAKKAGHCVDTIRIRKDTAPDAVDLLSYDFVFIGSGVYEWLPGKPMMNFLMQSHKKHLKNDILNGDIKPNAPKKPGKKAVAYCTFGGSHVGINEAIPTTKYLSQLFDHLGFTMLAEWHFVGEYHGKFRQLNKIGRMGDITDRPNAEDLRQVAEMTTAILKV